MKRNIQLLLMLVFCTLIFTCCTKQYTSTSDIETTTSEIFSPMQNNDLLSKAPPFVSDSCRIIQENDTFAIAEFTDVTHDAFEKYKAECALFGFNLDGFVSNEYYIASNLNGYLITVVYSEEKMMIEIDAPN